MNIYERYLSNNYTAGRSGRYLIQGTFHTAVSNVDSLYPYFNTVGLGKSSSAYVNKYGDWEKLVRESDTSWCNANWDSNCKSYTIETWDGGNGNNVERTPELYETCAQIVVYFYKNYGIPILLLTKDQALAGQKGWTKHLYYAATSCPAGLDYPRIINRAIIINGGTPMPTFDYTLYKKDSDCYMHVTAGSIAENITITRMNDGTTFTTYCNKTPTNDGGPIIVNMNPIVYSINAKQVIHQFDNSPVVDPCANVKAELETTKKQLADEQAKNATLTEENAKLEAELATFVPSTIYYKK